MAAARGRKDTIEDDEYWSGSLIKKSTGKFNLFDDEVSVDSASAVATKVIAAIDEDDNEKVDVVNWDGSAVEFSKSKHLSSSMHIPKQSLSMDTPSSPKAATLPSATRSSESGTEDICLRTQSFSHGRSKSDSIRSGGSFVRTDSHTLQEDLNMSESSRSIEEITNQNASKSSSVSSTHMEREILFLRRSLEAAKTKPPVEKTLKKMFIGEDFSLTMYRSKEDKLALLDKAVESHDGNSITTAVLFLKQTLSPRIFREELRHRPVSVSHYISYLKAHKSFSELVEFLRLMKRNEEAAMLQYKQAISVMDFASKISSLERCRKEYFDDPALATTASFVENHISLLKWQKPIDETDAIAERNQGSLLFKEFPRPSALINMSVITSLYYCCLYHYTEDENAFASPFYLKNNYQLTEKQFLWTALSAKARLKQWHDIDGLLTKKGWFGSTKLKAAIGFDKVAEVLHKSGAPSNVQSHYLLMVVDNEKRLTLAKKLKCHEVVIKTLVAMKDRNELEAYVSKLPVGSVEHRCAHDALTASTIKWKA